MFQQKPNYRWNVCRYSACLFSLFLSVIYTVAQSQVPNYIQHQNWKSIPMNWNCMDENIGKKFVPFNTAGLNPPPTIDYPATYAGRAVSHAFSSDTTLYVGFSSGGLWQLQTYPGKDSVSWKILSNSSFLSQSIGAVHVDQSNKNNIVVATGSYENGNGRGLYYTVNGGLNWTYWPLNMNVQPETCYVLKKVGTNYYVGTQNGLYTANGLGGQWSEVSIGSITGTAITDFVSFNNGATLFVAVSNNGVYSKSGNGAWQIVPNTPISDQIDLECTNNLVYALASQKLYSCQPNSGFTLMNSSVPGTYNTLKVSSNNKTIFMGSGGDGIYRSTDTAKTFPPVTNNYTVYYLPNAAVHVDQRGFAMNPQNNNTVYALCDGGVYCSRDNGNNWLNLNIGLQTFQVTSMKSSQLSNNLMAVGLQDNGLQYIEDGEYSQQVGGDGGNINFNPADSLQTFSITNGIVNAIGKPSLQPVGCCFSYYDGGYIYSLAVNPKNSNTQYISTNIGLRRLFNANNYGQPPYPQNLNAPWKYVIQRPLGGIPYSFQLAYDGIDTSTVYFVANQGGTNIVYTIKSPGVLVDSTSNIPMASPFAITSSPNKTGRTFIVGLDKTGSILSRENSGDAYTTLPGSLPALEMYYLIETPKTSTGIIQRYLGTEMGMYWSFDSRGGWYKVNGDLPNIKATTVEYHIPTNNIRVSTYGRGVWEVPCPIFSVQTLALSQLTGGIYGSKEDIAVQNNVNVNTPNSPITLIAQKGISFGPGFSIEKGTELSAIIFSEIK